MIRRWLVRHGWKPFLLRCPDGAHSWYETHGDRRGAVGARYICRECPAKTDRIAS